MNVAVAASESIISTPITRSAMTVATASVRRPGESLARKDRLEEIAADAAERHEVEREAERAEPHRVDQAEFKPSAAISTCQRTNVSVIGGERAGERRRPAIANSSVRATGGETLAADWTIR